jgi:hypothetical protein
VVAPPSFVGHALVDATGTYSEEEEELELQAGMTATAATVASDHPLPAGFTRPF